MSYVNETYIAEWSKAYAEVMEQSVASMLVGLDTPAEKLFRLIDESSGETTAIERLSMKKDAYMQIINSVVSAGQQTAIALVDKKFTFNYELKLAEYKVDEISASVGKLKADAEYINIKADIENDSRASKKTIIQEQATQAQKDTNIKIIEEGIITSTKEDKIDEIKAQAELAEQKANDMKLKNGWRGTTFDYNESLNAREAVIKKEQARLTMRQRLAYDDDRNQKALASASNGYAMIYETIYDADNPPVLPTNWSSVDTLFTIASTTANIDSINNDVI